MLAQLRCILSIHNFAQTSLEPLHADDPKDPRSIVKYECLDCGVKRGEVR